MSRRFPPTRRGWVFFFLYSQRRRLITIIFVIIIILPLIEILPPHVYHVLCVIDELRCTVAAAAVAFIICDSTKYYYYIYCPRCGRVESLQRGGGAVEIGSDVHVSTSCTTTYLSINIFPRTPFLIKKRGSRETFTPPCRRTRHPPPSSPLDFRTPRINAIITSETRHRRLLFRRINVSPVVPPKGSLSAYVY